MISPTLKGKRAEDQARAHLESKGYRFLCANFRTPLGELDLVMEQENLLIFVEVRSRNCENFARPFETVTRAKQKKVVKTAIQYVKSHNRRNAFLRFDVVSIEGDRLEHLENAFGVPSGRYTL